MNYVTHMSFDNEGRSSIVLIPRGAGEPMIITDDHPNFVRIADAVLHQDDVSEWLDIEDATDWFIDEYLEADVDWDDWLSEDESERDDFEPTPVIESLSDTIERYRREGRDAENLVRFMRRLAKNPSRRSREQLFQWSVAKDLTIDADGYIIGFKGVREDLLSVNAGTAHVDGKEVSGHIPNVIGTVISMPRSEVQDDPNQGCSYGLHVGTFNYARSWGSVVLEVRIDPADVVSVPADSGFAKMRCCEYEVIAIHETDTDDLSEHEPESQWNQDEAFEAFEDKVPSGFIASLKARLTRKGR